MAGVRFEDVDLLGALSRIVDLHGRMLHFSKRGENWSYSSSTALLSPFFAPQMASLNAPILVFLHFFTDFLASVATVCTYGVLFDTQFGSRVGHR